MIKSHFIIYVHLQQLHLRLSNIHIYKQIVHVQRLKVRMTVTHTKQSSVCTVGTLNFEFKVDRHNRQVSDCLLKICFCDSI